MTGSHSDAETGTGDVLNNPSRGRARMELGSRWPIAIGTVMVMATLWWSFVQAPLMSDDVIFQSRARSNGRSILGAMGAEVRDFLTSGRMNIFNPVQGGLLFQLKLPTAVYRGFQFAVLCIGVVLLWAVVKQLTGRSDSASVASLAAVLVLELRRYHDAILDFHALMGSALALFLAALLVALRNTQYRTRGLIISGGLLAASLLYNEIGYSLIPIWLLLTFLVVPKVHRLRFSISWLVPTLMLACVTVFVRSTSTKLYPGYKPSISPIRVLKTFIFQLSATLPYSYRFVAQRFNIPVKVHYARPTFSILVFLGLLGAGLAAYGIIRQSQLLQTKAPGGSARERDRRPALLLAGISLTMMVLPALMISTSTKYQAEVLPGMGYIPVLFQHFGLAFGAAALYEIIRQFLPSKRFLSVLFVALVAVAGGLTTDSWAQTVRSLKPTATARSLLESSIRSGLWRDVAPGSKVQLYYLGWSTAPNDITRFGGPRVVTLPGLGENCPCRDAEVDVVAVASRSGEGALLIADTPNQRSTLLVRGPRLIADLKSGRRVVRFGSHGSTVEPIAVSKSSPKDFVFSVVPDRGSSDSQMTIVGLETLSYYT